MKLDIRAFAIASAIVAAILFVVCAFFVAIAPKETTAVAGHLIHADLSGIMRSLTWGNFFGGLVGWTFGTAIVAGATAWLYNRLARG
jgi:hypothetical protein